MRISALIGLLTLAVANQAFGQWGEVIANPETYKSPSGHYSLRVNPDDRHAETGANYRATLNGKVVWEKHFSFALFKAGITDDGRFGGYAVRNPEHQYGEIVVVIGDRTGNIILSEVRKRRGTLIIHGSPRPRPEGLILDGPNDRMIVRASDPTDEEDRGGSQEKWWTYRLSDGKPGPTLDPRKYTGKDYDYLVDARPLTGTPLTLLSWWHFDNKAGAIITLVDANAKPVWRLDMDGDYEIGKDSDEKMEAVREFQQSGSILAVRDKHFDLRFVQKNQTVSYRVMPEGNGWKVVESARKPFQSAKGPAFPSVPKISLQLKRKWTLPLAKLPDSPIHDIEDFELVEGNRIATLRGGDSPALILSDLNGGRSRTIDLPMLKDSEYPGNCLASMGGDKFAVSDSPKDKKTKARVWSVDFSTKKVRPFADLGAGRASAIASAKDSSIVVLANQYSSYTLFDTLTVYDSHGHEKWQKSTGDGYAGKLEELLSPEDVAVDSQGRIVVLDNIKNCLQIFSSEGKYLSNKPFPKVNNQEVSYPTHLRCIGSGYLVWDMTVAYLLDSNCKVQRKYVPQFKNSRPLDSRNDPQIDATGRMWICDSDAIHRLNTSSVVDRTVGQVGNLSGLRKVSDLTVTQNGTTIARDNTSDEVHLFDAKGAQTGTIRPLKSDLSNTSFRRFGQINVDDLSRIYIKFAKGYVRFSASGRRESAVNVKENEAGSTPKEWKVGSWWNGSRLFDGDGTTITLIKRLPNEDWLSPTLNVSKLSPSGNLAILSLAEMPGDPSSPLKVGFYGRTGRPESTATIQANPKDLWEYAYDGRALYFARDSEVLAFDKNGKALWKFMLPTRKHPAWSIFSSQGGLALFDGTDTVYRYAVPK